MRKGASSGWAGLGSLGIALCAATALGGCSSIRTWFHGDDSNGAEPSTTVDPGNGRSRNDDRAVDELLSMMEQLIDGDEITQAAMMRSAGAAVEFMATPHNRLKYALALSIPGHEGSDLQAATVELGDLLAAGELLPRERMLATIQIRSVNRLLALQASRAELDAALRAARAEGTANAERLRELETNIQRLQGELRDATAKLDAITGIEQSISERDYDEN